MSARADPLAATLADRPTWAVAALAVGIVCGTLLTIVTVVAVAAVTAPLSPLPDRLHQAVVGVPVVLGLYEGTRRLAGVPAAWLLAARPSGRLWAWGAVGLLLPTAVLGVQLWLLRATIAVERFALGALAGAVLSSVASGVLAGLLEELALRGALLRVLEARWGPRVAVWLTAGVFAVLHQGHAEGGVQLALVLASMSAAGLLLSVVAVRTRNVWNAVALHAGWNTVFGSVLVTAAGAHDPGVVRFSLPGTGAVETGGGATLGAAPLTTAGLLLAAAFVARAPGRWLGRDRPTAVDRTAEGR